MKTWDYLERVRALNDGCSDYRLAQVIGVKQPSMVRYRQGGEMDDDVALRVAVLLKLPPEAVVFDVRRARALHEGRSDMAKFWGDLAAKLARAACLVMALAVSFTVTQNLQRTDADSVPADVATAAADDLAVGRIEYGIEGAKLVPLAPETVAPARTCGAIFGYPLSGNVCRALTPAGASIVLAFALTLLLLTVWWRRRAFRA